jgi:hypothetical protein
LEVHVLEDAVGLRADVAYSAEDAVVSFHFSYRP